MNADEAENATENLKWSISTLDEIIHKEYFPSSVKDLSVQKDIITRFFNFYLGGKIQKGLGVEDVVFAVLSILPSTPYNEKIIWGSAMYKDDGKAFFLTPEEKLASQEENIIDRADDVNTREVSEEATRPNSTDIAEDIWNVLNDAPTIYTFNDDNETFEANTLFESDEPSYDFNNVNSFTALHDDDVIFTRAQDNDGYDETQDQRTSVDIDIQENNVPEDPIDIQHNILPNLRNDVPFSFSYTSMSEGQKENKILNYGPVENAAFVRCCNVFLSRWDTDGHSRAVLKSFFGVVALVLMRATTKAYKHLFSTFHGEKFLRFLRHTNKLGLKPYCPPHKRCLKRAYRTFNRRDKKTPTMFAKIMLLALADESNKYIKYVSSNGLMNYTADYGFNLIRLLRTVCSEVFRGNVRRLMELTLCEATEASWKRVVDFLNEYFSGEASSTPFFSTYRWARVLDSRHFKHVSCQQNYALAVILAVFCEKSTGDSGVWQATWVENDALEQYRELGNSLYDRYLSEYQDQPGGLLSFELFE